MKRLAIVGSRELAQLLAHHALESHSVDEVVGFFDDFQKVGVMTDHGPILGKIEDVFSHFRKGRFDSIIIGIGYNHLSFRESCFKQLQGKIPISTVISLGCHVDSTAKIGSGSFLLPGCTLDKGVIIENNSVLNTGVTIAHDSRIGSSCFLGPGVSIAGFVHVKPRCFLGVGSVLIDSITLSSDIQTGGGSVVVCDLEQPGLYLGVPAKLHRGTNSG